MNAPAPRILIVDDEPQFCELTAAFVRQEGGLPLVAHDGKSALQKIRLEAPDVLLLDLVLPDIDGLELLPQIKAIDEDLPVVVITAHAELSGAVKAMRAAAYDYLSKPVRHEELSRIVHKALAYRTLRLKLQQLSCQINVRATLTEIMGHSDSIEQLIAGVNRVAKSTFSVIILGETGSGKEVVARAIHEASPRCHGPFIPVDCGAIPETLLEGELFGHEKGAFTGATSQMRGKFELAKEGTLLLDEISNMPLSAQAKVLRALQERTIYRVGGTVPLRLDVRVLAASNEDLVVARDTGRFREDLFYRLNEFTLRLPPLRERKEDILYLAKRFIDLANKELNRQVKGLSDAAISVLLSHSWPGNVRQLRSTIRRAVLLADDMVTPEHLDIDDGESDSLHGPGRKPPVQAVSSRTTSLRELVDRNVMCVEREALVQTLQRTSGNKAQAARLLHIDYKTIHAKVKKYGITLKQGAPHEKQTHATRSHA